MDATLQVLYDTHLRYRCVYCKLLCRRGEAPMEFAFTAEEQTFREDIRQFLRDHPPEHFAHEGMDAGYGSGAHSHTFMRQLGARGWLSMCWPREYGGQERPLMHKLILLEELAAAGAPFGPLGGIDKDAELIFRSGHYRVIEVLLPLAAPT